MSVTDPARAMMDEILEQPELLRFLVEHREELTAPFVELVQKRRIKRVFFTGNGSPWYVGCALMEAAGNLLGADASAVPSAYFNRHGSLRIPEVYAPEEVLLVCPAESGHSRGQVDAARAARAAGAAVICTTLIPDGVLARECDVVLPKPGGHEVAMATTKGQTIALLELLMCFVEAGRALGRIDEAEYARFLRSFEDLPGNVAATIDASARWFERHRDAVMAAEQFFILGYGSGWGTAQEAALKFYECHQVPTLALELEEGMHGPFRAVRKDDLVFFICAEEGQERDRALLLADALAVYNDNRVCLRRTDDPHMGPLDIPVASSGMPYVSAIEYLIPFQMLSFLISEAKGIDLSIPLVPALDPVMVPGYED